MQPDSELKTLLQTVPKADTRPLIQFFTPSELRDYKPPEGIVLVGDCHLTRGAVTVIGGAPGIGKSRAVVALAEAGATGANWFGLKVHRPFKTLVIQNENGRFRLSKEFADLDCATLDAFVRVCEPPPLGLAFDKPEFQATVTASLADFQPDVVVLDPWNAIARDEKARDRTMLRKRGLNGRTANHAASLFCCRAGPVSRLHQRIAQAHVRLCYHDGSKLPVHRQRSLRLSHTPPNTYQVLRAQVSVRLRVRGFVTRLNTGALVMP
jgi:hypothetical protein